MAYSRRSFLSCSTSTFGLGFAASFGMSGRSFAAELADDKDPSSLKQMTQKTGDYDQWFTESYASQINWTYRNSQGQLISLPLMALGDSISHPTNPLLSWYYGENDSFESSNYASQIDENFLVLSRRDDLDALHSFAVAKRVGEKLELVGVISEDQLLNDVYNSLPAVNTKKDTLIFQAAIGNLYENDVFTGVFLSDRLMAVIAINDNGIARVLYYFDKNDENQNVLDLEHPELTYAPGIMSSLPRHNLANDGKYSMFFRSSAHGLSLFNIEANGLKLVKLFHDGTEESGNKTFLSFPKNDYDWSVSLTAKNGKPADSYVQALSNMGPDKETLMHWQLADGHHVFTALHADENGEYVVHPRACLRAHEPLAAGTDWTLRPFDNVKTIISASHADAADHLVYWNRSYGCAFVSLDHDGENGYEPRLLRTVNVDEKYHENSPHKFVAGDNFFFSAQSLTQNRRTENVVLYQYSKQKSQGNLLKTTADETVRYHIHVHSVAQQSVYSMDYVAAGDDALQSASSGRGIQFQNASNALSISRPAILGGNDKDVTSLPSYQDAADKFWKDFLDRCLHGDDHADVENEKKNLLDDEATKAAGYYKDHYGASEGWVVNFIDEIRELKKRYIHVEVDGGLTTKKLAIWTGGSLFAAGLMGAGAAMMYFAREQEILANKAIDKTPALTIRNCAARSSISIAGTRTKGLLTRILEIEQKLPAGMQNEKTQLDNMSTILNNTKRDDPKAQQKFSDVLKEFNQMFSDGDEMTDDGAGKKSIWNRLKVEDHNWNSEGSTFKQIQELATLPKGFQDIFIKSDEELMALEKAVPKSKFSFSEHATYGRGGLLIGAAIVTVVCLEIFNT